MSLLLSAGDESDSDVGDLFRADSDGELHLDFAASPAAASPASDDDKSSQP